MDLNRLKQVLVHHEGLRLKPYRDTVGKLTIGIGRNLEDKGITKEEAYYLLLNDIKEVVKQLDKHLPWWRNLDDIRQEVLINMAFNLGIYGLLKFKKFLKNLQEGNYKEAAREMLNSKWASQVKRRAEELAYAMEHGEYPEGIQIENTKEEDKLLQYLNEKVWNEINNGW